MVAFGNLPTTNNGCKNEKKGECVRWFLFLLRLTYRLYSVTWHGRAIERAEQTKIGTTVFFVYRSLDNPYVGVYIVGGLAM